MALDPKKNHNDIKNEIKNEIQKERRSFLKKTVYAAPSIAALGQLIHPTVAGASIIDNTDGPGGGNGGGFGGGGSGGFGGQG